MMMYNHTAGERLLGRFVLPFNDRPMDRTEVKKTCYACGADVTHKSRHKSGQGKYLCSTCLAAKKTKSSRQRTRGRVLARSGRVFLYVLLAAGGAWLFYYVLDMFVSSYS
jgi:hypothetical protein